ncbi:MAG: heavy metal translocating P-type ATPase [Gammaproteobacteria bacterium]
MSSDGICFHCGEPVLTGQRYLVKLAQQTRPVCCPGCKAVAEFIRDSGLSDYYEFRTAAALRPNDPELAATTSAEWLAFDRPAVLERLSSLSADGYREALLLVEGVRCAACSWLIERSLGQLPGAVEIQVNPATARARLIWNPRTIEFSRLLDGLARLGYRPHPVQAGAQASIAQREHRQAMKRLAVAGLGMMQVLTYAVSLYAGAFQGMDEDIRSFLRLISLLVATPVVLYSGFPFFQGAWRDLRAGRPGMDVPVALAIGAAYIASLVNGFRGVGEVYFDSVTMFVFLLSLGRFAEMTARHRAGEMSDALSRLAPSTALRLMPGTDQAETVGTAELNPGDQVLIRAGDPFPADGSLESETALVDESMITGESRPVRRLHGEPVIGGSLNVGDPVKMRVERIGADTVLSHVARLLQRAQADRPSLARSADLVARWFVIGVLIVAAGVAVFWAVHDPAHAFAITLSVLVVTCPCALSLATPTALTAATTRLASAGLLVTRADALEKLARADHVIFDKTGTLTQGRVSVTAVQLVGEQTREQCLRIAAALERRSEHPIARAFSGPDVATAEDTRVFAGYGVEGTVNGNRYRIGRPDFVAALSGGTGEESCMQGDTTSQDPDAGGAAIALGGDSGLLAYFSLSDPLREGARTAVRWLLDLGLQPEIVSGDEARSVKFAGQDLGISSLLYRQTPEDKLNHIRCLQGSGRRVVAVGDGVNDAPVLAGADVSVAMSSGAPLAQTSADMVLMGESLMPLTHGVSLARRTLRVIRQNLGWALTYNLVALPMAAAGWLAPWMAAIGMSASSVLVILNSMRLSRAKLLPRQASSDTGTGTDHRVGRLSGREA